MFPGGNVLGIKDCRERAAGAFERARGDPSLFCGFLRSGIETMRAPAAIELIFIFICGPSPAAQGRDP
jgi:hypothetical protein